MKQLLFILFIFASSAVFGQVSLSVGYLKLRETLKYDVFSIQADYDFRKFRIYSEFGYFSNKMEHNTEWEGTEPGKTYSYEKRYSKINFSYATVKLGVGKQYKITYANKFWNAFSINFFGQYDRETSFKVSDQVTYKTSLYYGNSYSNYNQVIGGKIFPPNYTPFEIGLIRKNIFRVGLDFKIRVGYKNLFMEVSTSMVSPITDRVNLVSSYPYSSNVQQVNDFPLFVTGVKIGYIFSKREKQQ